MEGVVFGRDSLYPVHLFLFPVALSLFHLSGGRHIGRLVLSSEKLIEVYVIEEPVLLHVVGSVLEVTISLGQLSSQQMLDERLELGVEAVGVLGLSIYDFSVNIHRIVILEWRVPGKHFVEEDSESPPVHWLAVALVQQDFRCDVFRGSADCVGALCDHFRESEVYQLQVAVRANHYVFRLQVSVHYFFTLEVLKNGDDLSAIKCGLLGVEVAHAPVVGEQVSSFEQLCHEVNVSVVLHEAVVFHLKGKQGSEALKGRQAAGPHLKSTATTYDEGVVEELEDLLFVFNVVDVLRLNDVVLFHGLYGHLGAGVLLEPRELDVSKCT